MLVGPWKRRDREARRDDRAPDDVHIRPARVVVGLAVASDPPVEHTADATHVSEVLRVERAMHEFGVLNLYPGVIDEQTVTAARDETLILLTRERTYADA